MCCVLVLGIYDIHDAQVFVKYLSKKVTHGNERVALDFEQMKH